MKITHSVTGLPVNVAVALPDEVKTHSGNVFSRTANRFHSASSLFLTSLKSSPSFRHSLMLCALMLVVVVFPHIANATDLLKTQQQDASDTFGLQSSVMRWIYFAEIIISVVGFIKTRNPLVFVGLIVVLLVTRAFYGMVG
ncbi:type IV conjugative transfer system pilin TraA [Pantoea sp. 1B4]|uniref:type IV conjugative transfer system pilin TraA n=1 Tax=Pantoea sp. 1B4 TaxID=2804760 RepID=UPI001AA5C622|nr:type IV conjugative transfer system pilin TraA [Pantoea sp. 1B4]MBN1090594.1 conjugal transfer protein [Pantoea sp. 1B4]